MGEVLITTFDKLFNLIQEGEDDQKNSLHGKERAGQIAMKAEFGQNCPQAKRFESKNQNG